MGNKATKPNDGDPIESNGTINHPSDGQLSSESMVSSSSTGINNNYDVTENSVENTLPTTLISSKEITNNHQTVSPTNRILSIRDSLRERVRATSMFTRVIENKTVIPSPPDIASSTASSSSSSVPIDSVPTGVGIIVTNPTAVGSNNNGAVASTLSGVSSPVPTIISSPIASSAQISPLLQAQLASSTLSPSLLPLKNNNQSPSNSTTASNTFLNTDVIVPPSPVMNDSIIDLTQQSTSSPSSITTNPPVGSSSIDSDIQSIIDKIKKLEAEYVDDSTDNIPVLPSTSSTLPMNLSVSNHPSSVNSSNQRSTARYGPYGGAVHNHSSHGYGGNNEENYDNNNTNENNNNNPNNKSSTKSSPSETSKHNSLSSSYDPTVSISSPNTSSYSTNLQQGTTTPQSTGYGDGAIYSVNGRSQLLQLANDTVLADNNRGRSLLHNSNDSSNNPANSTSNPYLSSSSLSDHSRSTRSRSRSDSSGRYNAYHYDSGTSSHINNNSNNNISLSDDALLHEVEMSLSNSHWEPSIPITSNNLADYDRDYFDRSSPPGPLPSPAVNLSSLQLHKSFQHGTIHSSPINNGSTIPPNQMNQRSNNDNFQSLIPRYPGSSLSSPSKSHQSNQNYNSSASVSPYKASSMTEPLPTDEEIVNAVLAEAVAERRYNNSLFSGHPENRNSTMIHSPSDSNPENYLLYNSGNLSSTNPVSPSFDNSSGILLDSSNSNNTKLPLIHKPLDLVLYRYARSLRLIFQAFAFAQRKVDRDATFDVYARAASAVNRAEFSKCCRSLGLVGPQAILNKTAIDNIYTEMIQRHHVHTLDEARFIEAIARVAIASLSSPPLQELYPSDGDKVDAVFKRLGLHYPADVARRLRSTDFAFAQSGVNAPAHDHLSPPTPEIEKLRKREARIAAARAERGFIGGNVGNSGPTLGTVTLRRDNQNGTSMMVVARDGSIPAGTVVALPPTNIPVPASNESSLLSSPSVVGYKTLSPSMNNNSNYRSLVIAGASAMGGGKVAHPSTLNLMTNNAIQSLVTTNSSVTGGGNSTVSNTNSNTLSPSYKNVPHYMVPTESRTRSLVPPETFYSNGMYSTHVPMNNTYGGDSPLKGLAETYPSAVNNVSSPSANFKDWIQYSSGAASSGYSVTMPNHQQPSSYSPSQQQHNHGPSLNNPQTSNNFSPPQRSNNMNSYSTAVSMNNSNISAINLPPSQYPTSVPMNNGGTMTVIPPSANATNAAVNIASAHMRRMMGSSPNAAAMIMGTANNNTTNNEVYNSVPNYSSPHPSEKYPMISSSSVLQNNTKQYSNPPSSNISSTYSPSYSNKTNTHNTGSPSGKPLMNTSNIKYISNTTMIDTDEESQLLREVAQLDNVIARHGTNSRLNTVTHDTSSNNLRSPQRYIANTNGNNSKPGYNNNTNKGTGSPSLLSSPLQMSVGNHKTGTDESLLPTSSRYSGSSVSNTKGYPTPPANTISSPANTGSVIRVVNRNN